MSKRVNVFRQPRLGGGGEVEGQLGPEARAPRLGLIPKARIKSVKRYREKMHMARLTTFDGDYNSS